MRMCLAEGPVYKAPSTSVKRLGDHMYTNCLGGSMDRSREPDYPIGMSIV